MQEQILQQESFAAERLRAALCSAKGCKQCPLLLRASLDAVRILVTQDSVQHFVLHSWDTGLMAETGFSQTVANGGTTSCSVCSALGEMLLCGAAVAGV